MLCLGLKVGEKIYIDHGKIVVQVTQVWGDKVKLGITAAKEIVVDRLEIHEKIQAERRAEYEAVKGGAA